MQSNMLIKNGTLLDPIQNLEEIGDLLVTGTTIAYAGSTREFDMGKTMTVLDAKGLVVCPGFIDLHCHLREPGFEDKETIYTGSRSAAAGGFTTICCMPNTNPPLDNKGAVDFVRQKAEKESVVRILPIGCITMGRQGCSIAEMIELAEAGVIGFSDDGDSVPNSRIMMLAMEYCRATGLPIIEHCEDKELSDGGSMNEGWVSTFLGLKGIPAAAEDIIVIRDIELAEMTGAKLHIAHVSTSGAVDVIRRAKEKGLNVTAEVTPHHLTLTEECVMGSSTDGETLVYDTNAKVNPPLRTRDDREALIKGLQDGTIDVIATDHAPHTLTDKLCEFEQASFGISGFETAFGCLMKLVHDGPLELAMLVSKLTTEPAKLLGSNYSEYGTLQAGTIADITIFDPNKEWKVDTSTFTSKGVNNPFNGYTFKGKVMSTIVSGNIVYRDSSINITEIK
jgi:dihydroorotase